MSEGALVFVSLKSFVFVLIVVLGPTGISLFHKFLQLSFSYELLYLLFQVSTVLCVFLLVAHVG